MVGDLQNNPGRSLFVRLTGPTSGPGARGKWTDSATSEFGDLLDIIRERTGITRFPDLLAEARMHLGRPQPVLPDANSPRSRKSPSGTPAAASRLFAASLPLAGSLAEVYLRPRGVTQAVPSATLQATGRLRGDPTRAPPRRAKKVPPRERRAWARCLPPARGFDLPGRS